MKTITPFQWAEQTNYTLDGSGDAWRTTLTATKQVPPSSFQTGEGLVPGDRFAAEWENYTRNLTAQALQAQQIENISRWQRLPATAVESTAWLWYPTQRQWLQPGSSSTSYRDITGSLVASKSQATIVADSGGTNGNFGVVLYTGGGATTSRRFTQALTGATHPLLATVDTPTSGTVLLFTSLKPGKSSSNAYLHWVGTSAGVWSVLSITSSGNWVATALTSPGTGITGVGINPGGLFFNNPVTGDLFLIGSDATNTTIYKYTVSSPGTWTSIYNGASLFGGGTLFSAPLYDDVSGDFVFVINASVSRATDNTSTRFKTSTYRSPGSNPVSATLDLTTTGLAVGPVQDLGSGCAVALCLRWAGLSSVPDNSVIVGMCVTVDYGATWRLLGQDLEVRSVVDNAGASTGMFWARFHVSPDSCIFLYSNGSGGNTTVLGLVRPGTDMATF